jgi:hypothetical protein
VRLKWPIAGAVFVGAAAVISYIHGTASPDAGEVFGLIAVDALVILTAVLVDLFKRRSRRKSNP